ncbi:unnamed protein product, partial [Prorocentrum cordatum]
SYHYRDKDRAVPFLTHWDHTEEYLMKIDGAQRNKLAAFEELVLAAAFDVKVTLHPPGRVGDGKVCKGWGEMRKAFKVEVYRTDALAPRPSDVDFQECEKVEFVLVSVEHLLGVARGLQGDIKLLMETFQCTILDQPMEMSVAVAKCMRASMMQLMSVNAIVPDSVIKAIADFDAIRARPDSHKEAEDSIGIKQVGGVPTSQVVERYRDAMFLHCAVCLGGQKFLIAGNCGGGQYYLGIFLESMNKLVPELLAMNGTAMNSTTSIFDSLRSWMRSQSIRDVMDQLMSKALELAAKCATVDWKGYVDKRAKITKQLSQLLQANRVYDACLLISNEVGELVTLGVKDLFPPKDRNDVIQKYIGILDSKNKESVDAELISMDVCKATENCLKKEMAPIVSPGCQDLVCAPVAGKSSALAVRANPRRSISEWWLGVLQSEKSDASAAAEGDKMFAAAFPTYVMKNLIASLDDYFSSLVASAYASQVLDRTAAASASKATLMPIEMVEGEFPHELVDGTVGSGCLDLYLDGGRVCNARRSDCCVGWLIKPVKELSADVQEALAAGVDDETAAPAKRPKLIMKKEQAKSKQTSATHDVCCVRFEVK